MKAAWCLVALFLIVPTAIAQRSGGFARSPIPSVSNGLGGTNRGLGVVTPARSGVGRYNRRSGYGSGYGYGWPYLPLWDYDYYGPYAPDYEQQTAQDPQAYGWVPPVVAQAVPPPPKPASLVIREYNFEKEATGSPREQKTFTIVLKDGSTRSATASWVLDGKLHYLDSRSLQQTLTPDMIDRDATDRANEQKNLRMELPPG